MAPERRVTNSDGVGDVFVWGSNETGVLGLTTAATRRKRPFPVALLDKSSPSGYKRLLPRCSHVAAGGVHSVAGTPEGALFTWGVGDEGQLARHVSREDVEGPAKPERVAMPTGAGAVVRENQKIPPFSIAVGVPAKVVGQTAKDSLPDFETRAVRYHETALRHVAGNVFPEES